MNFIQARWKAVLATLTTFASGLLAFYNANQNVTLKQVVMSAVGALIGGIIVHQVPNKNTEQ